MILLPKILCQEPFLQFRVFYLPALYYNKDSYLEPDYRRWA